MMTSRQRWLAALRMEPVDRLPFWPKLDGAYRKHRSGRFAAMSVEAIHDYVGSDKHIWVGNCLRETRGRTSVETVASNGERVTRYATPSGTLTHRECYNDASDSWHPIEFPVKGLEDVRLLTEWFLDTRVEVDDEALREGEERMRRPEADAVYPCTIGESPLMLWVEHLAGVQNAHFLLLEHQEEVEDLFEAIHALLLRKTELAAEVVPWDCIYFSENTSTTLISPEQYRRYCFRHIMDYGRACQERGKLLALHMCGHLKLILPDLARLPVGAFEAFTSPPVGNTTLLDGRSACPDTCLVGGTNATLWTYPAERIIAELERDLDALPHHRGVVVTSAGVMPPICKPETIKTVCDWVKAYPVRV